MQNNIGSYRYDCMNVGRIEDLFGFLFFLRSSPGATTRTGFLYMLYLHIILHTLMDALVAIIYGCRFSYALVPDARELVCAAYDEWARILRFCCNMHLAIDPKSKEIGPSIFRISKKNHIKIV
jgi:hypothetical protein